MSMGEKSFAQSALTFCPSRMTHACATIGGSRLLLNLRSAYFEEQDGGSTMVDTSFGASATIGGTAKPGPWAKAQASGTQLTTFDDQRTQTGTFDKHWYSKEVGDSDEDGGLDSPISPVVDIRHPEGMESPRDSRFTMQMVEVERQLNEIDEERQLQVQSRRQSHRPTRTHQRASWSVRP